MDECWGTFADPEDSTGATMLPREWNRSTLHFDNVPVALLTLFEIARSVDISLALMRVGVPSFCKYVHKLWRTLLFV